MVSPARFLPQLAKLPCELEVANWMLEQSCTVATNWSDDKILYFTAFKSQLEQTNLHQNITATLQATSFNPRRLVFQITESDLTELPEATIIQLAKMQASGIRILISQYGSSNLSLPQMRNLPINGLKIDATLTDRLETNGQLIRGITALSASLGLTVMADGVSTARQLAALSKLGCKRCQGSYIGVPTPNIKL